MPKLTTIIRDLRDSQGMTQEAAAKLAGFKNRGVWERYESGRHAPGIAKLRAIAKALGVPVSRLLGE